MSTSSIVTKCDHIFYIKLKMSSIYFSFLLSGRNFSPLSTNGLLSGIQFIIDLITKVRQYHKGNHNTIYHGPTTSLCTTVIHSAAKTKILFLLSAFILRKTL